MRIESIFYLISGAVSFCMFGALVAFLINRYFIARPVHAYKGPKCSIDKIAVLCSEDDIKHPILFGLNKRVIITRIDDKLIVQLLSILLPIPARNAHLLPGKHNVNLLFLKQNFRASCKLWFLAEEGKSYTAKAEPEGYVVRFWIEDDTTGKKTGGIIV